VEIAIQPVGERQGIEQAWLAAMTSASATDAVHTGCERFEADTILVVDDDPKILAAVSQLLADSRYDVLSAPSGAEGLRQSRAFGGQIQLLLSDFQMPGMSGVELATAITQERSETKVLLMSGFAGGVLALSEGWQFLAKPFASSHLCALVAGLISPDSRA
jgi:DNA-binding NtrC family response regulator